MPYKPLPKSGTAIDVDGIISANSKKNTVNERRIDMDNDTCRKSDKMLIYLIIFQQHWPLNNIYIYILISLTYTFSPESEGR